jgi:hypothetical protein
MTYDDAAAHFESAVTTVFWDGEGGDSALLELEGIQEWQGQDWWFGYVCTFAQE